MELLSFYYIRLGANKCYTCTAKSLIFMDLKNVFFFNRRFWWLLNVCIPKKHTHLHDNIHIYKWKGLFVNIWIHGFIEPTKITKFSAPQKSMISQYNWKKRGEHICFQHQIELYIGYSLLMKESYKQKHQQFQIKGYNI